MQPNAHLKLRAIQELPGYKFPLQSDSACENGSLKAD